MEEKKVTTYIGGGTDIMPLLKYGVRSDTDLVFIKHIPGLDSITHENGCWEIGAGVTLETIQRSGPLEKALPALVQAAASTASPQIRNIATLGGNLLQDRRCIYFNQPESWRQGLPLCFKTGGCVCHQIPVSPVCRAIYYSDTATALLAYEAEAVFEEDGEERVLPLADLIRRHSVQNGLGWQEHIPLLLKRVRVKDRPDGEWSAFYKYAMRASIDFPLINFALSLSPEKAVLAAGAVAPEPVLLPETASLILRSEGKDAVVSCCEQELKKLAKPIREALITPLIKRELYKQVAFLLDDVTA